MKITRLMGGTLFGLEATNSWSRGTIANWIKKSKIKNPINIYCFMLSEISWT